MADDTSEHMENDGVELIPLEGCTSKIWKFFGFPGKDGQYLEKDKRKRNEVTCTVCSKRFKYCGNTSNMRFHLSNAHPNDFASMEREENEAGSTLSKKRGASKSSRNEAMDTGAQQQLPAMFEAQKPLNKSNPRWKKLTDSICYFLAKDMMPFDTVNDPGFRNLLNTFEPRYTPPDRKTISTRYMPDLYQKEKHRVQQHLNDVEAYAITTDMWTSRAKQSYCAITVHFTTQYKMNSYLISVHEFPESHTAVNIVEEVNDVLSEWNMPVNGIVAATTDNGANITAAIEMLGVPHLPCFSHTLQLAVEQALKLPEVSKMVGRCKRVVAHFNRSPKSYYLLHQKQIGLGHKQHSLINDVVTRWNSSYYMIERILEQEQPLCATLLELKKGNLMPTDVEFSNMELFVKLMKPIVEITEALGAQQYVTISMIRPLLHKLLNGIFQNSENDSRLTKMMKLKMKENLYDRYTGPILDLLNKAAFLDPRFKLLTFIPDSEKERTIDQITIEAATCCVLASEADCESSSSRCTFRGERKLLHILGDVVQPHTDSEQEVGSDDTDKARREVARYSGDEDLGNSWTDHGPLEWWARSSNRYPRLAQLAMKYLGAPATSVPAEQAFSMAGNIVNVKRSCLLPDNVNMLVFLASNLNVK